jgi:hypothetical protein
MMPRITATETDDLHHQEVRTVHYERLAPLTLTIRYPEDQALLTDENTVLAAILTAGRGADSPPSRLATKAGTRPAVPKFSGVTSASRRTRWHRSSMAARRLSRARESRQSPPSVRGVTSEISSGSPEPAAGARRRARVPGRLVRRLSR